MFRPVRAGPSSTKHDAQLTVGYPRGWDRASKISSRWHPHQSRDGSKRMMILKISGRVMLTYDFFSPSLFLAVVAREKEKRVDHGRAQTLTEVSLPPSFEPPTSAL